MANKIGLTGAMPSVGTQLQTAGNMVGKTVNKAINTYMTYNNAGSAMANAASQRAQDNQFAFNSAEAALNRDYNTSMWEEQKAYNSAEAEKNRAFQASEAEKTRRWQENLANTSYQRAVEDLKKAGLNPILAYMNGATTPSGATASGSQASGGLQSGQAASGSNYTGQGHNMSEAMALFGAIGSIIGEGMTALGAYLGSKQDQNEWMTEYWNRVNPGNRAYGYAEAAYNWAKETFNRWGDPKRHSSGGGHYSQDYRI